MRYWIAVAALALRTTACMAALPPEESWNFLGDGQEHVFIGNPTIAIARDGVRVKITFSGTLESAADVSGPWTEVLNAASPLSLDPAGPEKFYRTRDPAVVSIFSSRSVVALTLTGPFQKHFELAFAGSPDGIFPPVREKPYFDGAVTLGGELPITLRVRGNSSLQECPFPKLKLKISKEDRVGTPFFDAREIKIGTHCAEGGRGNIGRLRDETATFREALVYETMELMGFITPRVRRARIEYHDTTPSTESPDGGWQLTRDALILDDVEVVGERLGGRALDDEEIEELRDPDFDEQLIADLQLFHALVGNWDYGLSLDSQGLWNTDVIELANQDLVPVAGDFDLCSWVTGVIRTSAPRDYLPELPDVKRQARYEVEQIQKRVTPPRFVAGSNRFAQHRAAIESQITTAQLDEPGRTNAFQHVTAFFEALALAKP